MKDKNLNILSPRTSNLLLYIIYNFYIFITICLIRVRRTVENKGYPLLPGAQSPRRTCNKNLKGQYTCRKKISRMERLNHWLNRRIRLQQRRRRNIHIKPGILDHFAVTWVLGSHKWTKSTVILTKKAKIILKYKYIYFLYKKYLL